MLKRLSEQQRRLMGDGWLLLLGLFLVGAIGETVVRVREGMDIGRQELRQAGTLMAEALDHELDVHVYNLLAMKYLADRFFAGRVRGAENPITRLVAVPEHGGYQSVLPASLGPPDTVGRITGLGPVPALEDPVADEMIMVVGLNPLMRAIRERSPDVPWVHYTSARGFMLIFPQQGSENFFFRSELFEREYYARATPQANPKRRPLWSKPYQDAAGKGRIITVTQPIYQADTFKGSVSIDVKVSSLQRRLGGAPIPKTHVHLVGPHGQIMGRASVGEDDSGDKPHDLIRLPLHSAPWTLELHINRDDLLMASLGARAWHMATVAVLSISLVFVTLLTRSGRRVRELAIHDGLTGLYNRRHFDTVAPAHFDLARRHDLQLGLAIIDIDFFKRFNDHYGHQQGDHALREVALALKSALRRGSDQVFRVGGEEFAVLLTFDRPDELNALMLTLNQAVRDLQIPHVGNQAGRMTISIGATAISKERWMSVDAAYQQADAALYEAKNAGRDRAVVIAPSLTTPATAART